MERYDKLKQIISGYEGILVAFSGGADSTLLLKAAVDIYGEKTLAVTVSSAFQTAEEIENAKCIAKKLNVKHDILEIDVFSYDNIVKNDELRCYHCKNVIMKCLTKMAEKNGYTVVEGSNFDDKDEYRPGTKAVLENGVKSPLKDAGLTKHEIRGLLNCFGFDVWNRPSASCLATRIPTNTPITKNALKTVENAELFLHGLGFKTVRLRHIGNTARIELPPDEFNKFVKYKNEVDIKLFSLGFEEYDYVENSRIRR